MPVVRKKIAIRFLFTLLFVVVFEILKTIIQLTILFQYIYLFIAQSLHTKSGFLVEHSFHSLQCPKMHFL